MIFIIIIMIFKYLCIHLDRHKMKIHRHQRSNDNYRFFFTKRKFFLCYLSLLLIESNFSQTSLYFRFVYSSQLSGRTFFYYHSRCLTRKCKILAQSVYINLYLYYYVFLFTICLVHSLK